MRHDNSYRRANRSYREASMNREAAMNRIADLQMKVAIMEHQAGIGASLKELFLRVMMSPFTSEVRRKLNLFTEPVDDIMDDVIEALAPSIAEKLMEAEVNSDVKEFTEGAKDRNLEKTLGGEGGYFPPMDPPDDKSDEYYMGYEWGNSNRLPLSTKAKKSLVEKAAKKFNKEVVESALRSAWNVINPVEILKHGFHLVKKHGWDPHKNDVWYKKVTMRTFNISLTVVAWMFVEFAEHVLLPAAMVKLTGNIAWSGLAAIPFIEIIAPIVGAYFNATKSDITDDENNHLKWYEKNFGEIEQVFEDKNLFTGRKANLRYRDLY